MLGLRIGGQMKEFGMGLKAAYTEKQIRVHHKRKDLEE